jgi:C-terminal processing protease CtpA/Prc
MAEITSNQMKNAVKCTFIYDVVVKKFAAVILPGLLLIVCVGCSSTPGLREGTIVMDERLSAIEFRSDQPINREADLELNQTQVDEDISFLVYVLEHAYSGSKKLPHGQFENMIAELNQYRTPQTVHELGQKIGKSFDKISDRHLNVIFSAGQKFIQFKNNNTSKLINVGKNVADGKVWTVERKSLREKNVLIVGITSFPLPDSEVWHGFKESVKEQIQEKDDVILDLRGNDGGDDAQGEWLAEYLNGGKIETPYSEPFDMNTPESFMVLANGYPVIRSVLFNQPLQSAEAEWVDKFKNLSTRASMGENINIRKELGESGENAKDNFNFNYKGNIYILIDGKCVSSGESTVDFFENVPRVKRIGQNTAGYIHFGNNGAIMLPNSSLVIRISISFNAYKDGRFIEKTGIKPDIYLEDGVDAYEYALKLIN